MKTTHDETIATAYSARMQDGTRLAIGIGEDGGLFLRHGSGEPAPTTPHGALCVLLELVDGAEHAQVGEAFTEFRQRVMDAIPDPDEPPQFSRN